MINFIFCFDYYLNYSYENKLYDLYNHITKRTENAIKKSLEVFNIKDKKNRIREGEECFKITYNNNIVRFYIIDETHQEILIGSNKIDQIDFENKLYKIKEIAKNLDKELEKLNI